MRCLQPLRQTEMGLGGGVECHARRGYTCARPTGNSKLRPDHRQAVQAGEKGEMVFTTLTRRGMPLVRYRTGDLSRFIPWKCPCGTVLSNLEKVTRRLGGKVILENPAGARMESTGGNLVLYMADLDEALFPISQLVNFRPVSSPGKVKTAGS